MNTCCVCGGVADQLKSYHCVVGNDVYHYCHLHEKVGRKAQKKGKINISIEDIESLENHSELYTIEATNEIESNLRTLGEVQYKIAQLGDVYEKYNRKLRGEYSFLINYFADMCTGRCSIKRFSCKDKDRILHGFIQTLIEYEKEEELLNSLQLEEHRIKDKLGIT